MKKNSSIFIIMLILTGMFYGIHTTFADVTIQSGSTLTINSADLDMNCTDIIVADGGTLDLGSGVVDELGELYVDPEGTLIEGSGTINPCSVINLGTVVIDPDPNEINASWTLECAGGYNIAGTGDKTLTDVPAGLCTITWGDVDGYDSLIPNPAEQYLDKTDTVTFSSSYKIGGAASDGSDDICFINALFNR